MTEPRSTGRESDHAREVLDFDGMPLVSDGELRERIADVIWYSGSEAALSIADRLIESGVVADPDAARAEGAAEALESAADEQERLAHGPRALGSRAVAFKRLIFAQWLRDRAATIRGVS